MARKLKKNVSTGRTPVARLQAMRTWIRDCFADRGQVMAKLVCWFVFLAAILVGGAAGFTALQRYAQGAQYAQGPVKYTVQLESMPVWMPATLGRGILEDVTPSDIAFRDPQLCRIINDQAVQSPWVAEVTEIRRERLSATEGVVHVRAKYRQPIARVSRAGRMYYVDTEGVVLPYSQTPKFAAKFSDKFSDKFFDKDDGVKYFVHRDAVPANLSAIRIHYIAIEGVEAQPPKIGQAWEGTDLAQGLRLVRLLSTRAYANQVSVVDVRNHARRISESEPELCIYAQQGQGKATEIRFGRFPHPEGGDWVISPARKMQYLDDYVHDQNGRLAGVHSYIDVRYDELRISLN